jgi:alkyl sulfatase BDS1-like metallo-beta-lactamase superfamily hydrolase
MGGADAVLEKARSSFDEGDYRWVVEVVNHVVFADPGNEPARLLQADALEQLAYASESGPWRDFYLTGAQELRSNGTVLAGLPGNALTGDMVGAMTTGLLLDLVGVRLNGPVAAEHPISFNLVVMDRDDELWAVGIENGTLHACEGRGHDRPDAIVRATHAGLAALASGTRTLDDLEADGQIELLGDRERFAGVMALLDRFSFGFEIVLP